MSGKEPEKGRGEGTSQAYPPPDSSAQLRQLTDGIEKLQKLTDISEIIERDGKEHVVVDKRYHHRRGVE